MSAYAPHNGNGNDSFQDFFKGISEMMELRFSSDPKGNFNGYRHVEFATVEATQETLELNEASFQIVEATNTSSNTLGTTEKQDEDKAIEPQE
ncbi:hypothetical protein V6N13_114161 [Hibiscus sabdariffa]